MDAYLKLSLLFGFFAVLHSLTAANFFKTFIGRVLKLEGTRYRLVYTVLSFPTAFPFAAYWLIERGSTQVLYSFSGIPGLLLLVLKLGGAAVLLLSLAQTGMGGFVGLKPEERRLITTGLYSRVRHPMYLGAVIFIWASPGLRSLDALLYLLATLYFAFGIYIEERRLLEEFGDAYENYRSRVPALIPKLRQ